MPESVPVEPPDGSTAPVWEIIRGLWRFTALHAMVELGCADELRDGPLPAGELARRCGADSAALERVLRTLAGTGLLASPAPGVYALTAAGATLRSDAPASMRPAVLCNGEEGSWYAMGALASTVRSGRSAFMERYGSLYEYLADRPVLGRLFDEFMRLRSLPLATGVAEVYDFSRIGTVVDVGGGQGTFLTAILRAHPHVRAVLYELPQVLPGAREQLTAAGVADRCELVAGDFFESVPAGADAYLLANIVHNWDDENALRIVKNVRAALPDHGRVLLVDMVLPDDDRAHLGKDLDMRMLALFGGGRERTESEYHDLLARADLRGRQVAELSALQLSLIEAVPAG